METYVEKINRFVVEYHEELPDEHKAQMRLNGIDPNTRWNLKWSFENEENAIEQKETEQEWYANFCKENGFKPQKIYRVRDLGETKYVERTMFF